MTSILNIRCNCGGPLAVERVNMGGESYLLLKMHGVTLDMRGGAIGLRGRCLACNRLHVSEDLADELRSLVDAKAPIVVE